jgi:predicted Zn-dependent peptidase
MKRRLALAAIVALAAASVTAQAPDRSRPPRSGTPPALKLPAIQKRQLTNGLPVWIVELHEVPVVQVSLLVTRGTGDDPPGKFGVASLTAAMLTEGAGSRSSLELADAIDFLGADLGASVGVDSSAVRLHIPVARLADALPLMADVAQRPTFPKEELERVRQQRLTSLLQARDSPETIASLAFSRVVYGPSHRYGTALMGTVDTIKTLGPADLEAFYRSAYRPAHSTLIVVGDTVPDRVMPLLEKSFGGWKAQGPEVSRPEQQTPAPNTGRQLVVVDKPNAPQSQIRIGGVGVARSNPDFFPIQVMNTILGGGFSSRLNLNLREKRGYTYGASSGFDMRRFPGPFTAAAGVQSDKTAESITEFLNELRGMLKEVPADELERAKNYVALRFPTTFETTGDIAGRLETLIAYGLPDDYYAKYVQQIQAVTSADVLRVAQRYLPIDRLTIVVAGDRKAIEAPIAALKLGTIKEMTIDEVFAPAQ